MSRSTRRADWALLLPSDVSLPVDVIGVVGGETEMGHHFVDAGVARRAVPAALARAAELAIVTSDAADDIDGAMRTVGAARVIVIEMDRGRRAQRWTTLQAVERRLHHAGCRVVSAHIVSPNFESPRRFVPIEDGAALRWHMRTLFVAASPAARVARIALLSLSRMPAFRRVAGAWAPRLLVIARRSADGSERAGIVGSPAAVAGDRAIVLTSGYDAGSRSIVLPIAAGDTAPRHVVKVATGPESGEATAGEHERLRRLHQTLPVGVGRALPLPLRELTIAGHEACVQSRAVGPSLQVLAGEWGRRPSVKAAELSRVVDWYNALARATYVRRHRHQWLDVFAAAATELPIDQQTRDFLSAAESRAVRTGLAELAVHQHYDAGPWNIHL